MVLRPLEDLLQEIDHKLTISKYLDGTPKGWSLLDKLGQTLKFIPIHEALSFVVVAPSANNNKVSSSHDNSPTICIQDYETAHGVPFLGATVKLNMHSLARDRAYLWWQTHLAQGSLNAVHGVQVYQLI